MEQDAHEVVVTRSQVDNPYKRNIAPNSYKNRKFSGKRITTDEYTGKKLYYSANGIGKGRNDSRHYTTNTASNVDHITPIDVLIKRYSDKVPVDDLCVIANSDYNLAVTNEAINKQKGGLTNLEYLLEQLEKGTPEDAETTLRMLAAQLRSETRIGADVTKIQIRNLMSKAGSTVLDTVDTVNKVMAPALEVGKAAALVSLTVSGLNNLAYVASEKKDLNSALKDVASDTASSFVSGTGLTIAQEILSNIAHGVGTEQIAGFVSNGIPTAQIAAAVMTARCVKQYLDGHLSGEDCALQILANGVGTIAYQLGAMAGGPAGAIIASVVVTQITNTILEYQQEKKIIKARDAEISHVLSCAASEIRHQRDLLERYTKEELKRWDDTINVGFDLLLQSTVKQDVSGVSQGLEIILSLFNTHVLYPSLEKFDQDFYDLNAPPLVL